MPTCIIIAFNNCRLTNIFSFAPSVIEHNAASDNNEQSVDYTAQGTFTSYDTSVQSSIAEAPDISAFQPVTSSKPAATPANTVAATSAPSPQATTEEKKRKKKKKSSNEELANFELPTHLIPLESDTPAQKLKKARAAKSLKSKFKSKQKEVEATKKASDWKNFANKKKIKSTIKASGSIFSTEEGVNARVGVVSGGGIRGMTGFGDGGGKEKKKHKFL